MKKIIFALVLFSFLYFTPVNAAGSQPTARIYFKCEGNKYESYYDLPLQTSKGSLTSWSAPQTQKCRMTRWPRISGYTMFVNQNYSSGLVVLWYKKN